MTVKKSVLAIALAAAFVPAAFATSGATWVGGEAGFETHPLQSTKSRAEVIKEMGASRMNLDTKRRDSTLGQSMSKTEAERRLFEERADN